MGSFVLEIADDVKSDQIEVGRCGVVMLALWVYQDKKNPARRVCKSVWGFVSRHVISPGLDKAMKRKRAKQPEEGVAQPRGMW